MAVISIGSRRYCQIMVPLGNGELVDAVWGFAMRSEGWLPDAVCCRTGGDKGVRGPFTGRNGG